MPVAMKTATATKDLTDRRDMPQMPCPDVQPAPKRVPTPTRTPARRMTGAEATDLICPSTKGNCAATRAPTISPIIKTVRHIQPEKESLFCGKMNDPNMPEIPANLPLASINKAADKPINAPPIKADTGEKETGSII